MVPVLIGRSIERLHVCCRREYYINQKNYRGKQLDSFKDENTGIEWKLNKSMDITFNEASSWVKSLDSNWRLPTIAEIEEVTLPWMFIVVCRVIFSGEEFSENGVWGVSPNRAKTHWFKKDIRCDAIAFAVNDSSSIADKYTITCKQGFKYVTI